MFTSLTSGCATITSTTNQSIGVQTLGQEGNEVRDAACELTNSKGQWLVTSPGSVILTPSNEDMQVVCNKQGLDPGRATVVSWIKGAMFGNILLGGGIGAIVDHNTGAAYEYPAFIQVQMGAFTKIDTPQTPAEQPASGDSNAKPAIMSPAQATTPPPRSSTPTELRSHKNVVIPNPLFNTQ